MGVRNQVRRICRGGYEYFCQKLLMWSKMDIIFSNIVAIRNFGDRLGDGMGSTDYERRQYGALSGKFTLFLNKLWQVLLKKNFAWFTFHLSVPACF